MLTFEMECESICFECTSKFQLKVIHTGVALCLWCRIKELVVNTYWRIKKCRKKESCVVGRKAVAA